MVGAIQTGFELDQAAISAAIVANTPRHPAQPVTPRQNDGSAGIECPVIQRSCIQNRSKLWPRRTSIIRSLGANLGQLPVTFSASRSIPVKAPAGAQRRPNTAIGPNVATTGARSATNRASAPNVNLGATALSHSSLLRSKTSKPNKSVHSLSLQANPKNASRPRKTSARSTSSHEPSAF